jgi:Polysaccharide deacetylase
MKYLHKLTFLFAFLFITLNDAKAQKVVLTFESNLSVPPSVSKAALRYNKDFAYSFTFDDAENDAFTVGLPLLRGGVVPNSGFTSAGFFYTDGCGNDMPFRAGVAWNTATAAGEDMHTGNVPFKLTWAQLDQLYTAGWDVLNHSYSHRARWEGTMTAADYIYQINQNPIAIQNKTTNRIKTPHFVVPSGDFIYQDYALAQGAKAVFDQNFPNGGVSFNGITVDNAMNFQNFKAHRDVIDEILVGNAPSKINSIAQQAQNGRHIWYNEFTHRIDCFDTTKAFNFYKLKDYFTQIAKTYGKTGSDRVWMASLPEVFEYLVVRDSLVFTTNVANGNKLELNFDVSRLPSWLPRRKCITLVINSPTNFTNVQLPEGVTGTWRGTGAVKLLNLDFANYTPPVVTELASFAGYTKQGLGVLSWKMAQEGRLKQFEVEKSVDGLTFNRIATVRATGTGADYRYTDSDLNGTAYYRLRMVKSDGTSELTKIVTLKGVQFSILKVKVSPSVPETVLKVEGNFEKRNLTATIQIFDINGQMHKMLMTDRDTTFVNIETLPTNFYLLRVTQGASVWVHKFTKL